MSLRQQTRCITCCIDIGMLLEKPLRKWGNAFGIMVSKAEAQRIGVRPGDLVDAEVRPHRAGAHDPPDR